MQCVCFVKSYWRENRMCKCCEYIDFIKESDKKTDKEIGTSHKQFAKISSYGWRKRKKKD